MPNDSSDAFAQVRATFQRGSTKSANYQIPAASFRFNV